MDKNIEITNIYEAYKELLTKNMQEIFELYYYQDLSLREIGENKGISYQACRDSIKKVEKQVAEYEQKLGLNSLKMKIEKSLDYIETNKSVDTETKVKNIKKILEEKINI